MKLILIYLNEENLNLKLLQCIQVNARATQIQVSQLAFAAVAERSQNCSHACQAYVAAGQVELHETLAPSANYFVDKKLIVLFAQIRVAHVEASELIRFDEREQIYV